MWKSKYVATGDVRAWYKTLENAFQMNIFVNRNCTH